MALCRQRMEDWRAFAERALEMLDECREALVEIRDTEAISAGMYAVTVVGFALWLSYGLLLSALPLIITYGICLLLSGFILMMKLLPPRSKSAVAAALDPES